MLYPLIFRLLLVRLDAERAHTLALRTLRLLAAIPGARSILRWLLFPREECLRVSALGLDFATPLGLAAGFDKDARAFEDIAALGFGCVEVGTVTALPQAGNERPRVFRLTRERALLNRMGFPNPGAAAIAEQLRERRSRATGAGPRSILGVNIGKSKATPIEDAAADYRESARALAPHADYLVLNVSSPNTPGLRELQHVERLAGLVSAVREELAGANRDPGARPVPLLVKIAPDLPDGEIDTIADLAIELELDGIIAVNTSTETTRTLAPASLAVAEALGPGGISGVPLKARALEVLSRLRARVGDRLVLISVGGIETPEDAFDRIRAGATLVQAYTGFVYGGPLWPRRFNRGLARLVREAGEDSIQELVGANTD